jgi:parvulin-like peptidyl-prolyl isomerase
MRRVFSALVAIAIGAGAGFLCAHFALDSFTARSFLGRFFARGNLVALVDRAGIYDADVDTAWRADLDAADIMPDEYAPPEAQTQKAAVLDRLIAEATFITAARDQPIFTAAITRDVNLLRAEWNNEKLFATALKSSALTESSLRESLADNLRARAWVEGRVKSELASSDAELRQTYERDVHFFQLPLRIRASHLFLAAPDGYPAEVLDGKRKAIEQIAERLKRGESFPDLIAKFSEDEATKTRGGDLNYFSAERMLPEFFDQVAQLPVGQISAPIRTHLGFHSVQVTDVKPAAQLMFEQAQSELQTAAINNHRATVLENLKQLLRRTARIQTP